jgi:hypothetical protein
MEESKLEPHDIGVNFYRTKGNVAEISLQFSTDARNGEEMEPALMDFNLELYDLVLKHFKQPAIHTNLRIFGDDNVQIFPYEGVDKDTMLNLATSVKPHNWSWRKFFSILRASERIVPKNAPSV